MSSQHYATPVSRLVACELRRADGEVLGRVDELLIDPESGRIEYVLAVSRHGQRLQFPWSSIMLKNGSFVLRRSHPRLVVTRAPHADP